jgi:hypothetical protein
MQISVMPPISNAELVTLAGTGSTDGRQEYAGWLLATRETARRAIELDEHGPGPPHDYRLDMDKYLAEVEAAFAARRARGAI